MIRTLSNVLFSIEYAVKSIAGTRCLSWITLSTQSGFCDITSGLLNLIFPSFTPVQQKRCLFSVRPGWDDERHVCHLWRLHHHLSDPPHGRHLLPALQEALLQATKNTNTNTNTNEKIQIKLMVATFSMLYKKHMYRQAQVDIKAHQEECFLGIRSWHEGCKHLGGTEPQKRTSYSTWPHMEAYQG